jgi:hypothetical protein
LRSAKNSGCTFVENKIIFEKKENRFDVFLHPLCRIAGLQHCRIEQLKTNFIHE